jgi:hypothetical protein
MEKLLEEARRSKEVKPVDARIDTMMRVRIAAFRGDVASEVRRVKLLAPHYGGAIVRQAPAEVPGVPAPASAPATLCVRVDAARVTEFVEAVRLGTHPPAATKPRTATSRERTPHGVMGAAEANDAGQSAAREFVTVEVTIDRDPAARPRR